MSRRVIENWRLQTEYQIIYRFRVRSLKHHRAYAECVSCKHKPDASNVRTMITLHNGLKTKSKSFASCRGRVKISGGSEIAEIKVEWKGDSLPVAVPLKVKKCFRACATPVIPSWQIRSQEATEWNSERIETAVLLKNLFIWQQLHSQPMAVWIISDSRVIWRGIELWHANTLKRDSDLLIHELFLMSYTERRKYRIRERSLTPLKTKFVTLNV